MRFRHPEDAEEWLDRLRDRDARFVYEVTFGGERGPAVFPPPAEPGLFSAMTDGRKVVKAYARDYEALKLDPVSSLVEFSSRAEEKLLDFFRTGREQHWGPDEIRAFSSSVPLLSDMKFVPGAFSMSVRATPDNKIIPMKLTFTAGDAKASLDYVEFRKLRGGSEEVEIASVGNPPLGMALVLPTNPNRPATATVTTHIPGNTIKDVVKACRALKLLESGCALEIVALKLDALLCTLQVEPLSLPFKDAFFTFVDDLNAIATKFNSNFVLPDVTGFSDDDEETFRLLRAIARDEPLDLSNFTTRLMKSVQNADLVPQRFRDEMVFRMEHEAANAKLFGTQIKLGPTVIQIDRAKVEGLAETLHRFENARMGTAVHISLRPLVPVRFQAVERASLLASRESPDSSN
jgi:hypothetical protein